MCDDSEYDRRMNGERRDVFWSKRSSRPQVNGEEMALVDKASTKLGW